MSELKDKTCLLDADIVAHRAACVAEKTEYLVKGEDTYEFLDAKSANEYAQKGIEIVGDPWKVWSRKIDLGKDLAIEAVQSTIKSIQDKSGCKELIPILSGKGNFRYAIATTVPYKSTREIRGKPKYLRACKSFIEEYYDAIVTTGIEADDELGIKSQKLGDRCFIASIDKDLDQLAGWHFDWTKDRVYRVSQKEADFALYRQILTGDSTDDIPGLRGVGPKAAEGILGGAANSQALFQRTWDAYRTRVDPNPHRAYNYFREQARLIYVLRKDVDREEHSTIVNLPGWQPIDWD